MECYILSATCQACVSVVCSLQHITNRFRTEQVATGCNHKCNRRQSVAYSFGSVHAKSTWYEDRFRSGCSQKRQKNRTGPDFKILDTWVWIYCGYRSGSALRHPWVYPCRTLGERGHVCVWIGRCPHGW